MDTQKLNDINNTAYQGIAEVFNDMTTRPKEVLDRLDLLVDGLSKDDLVLDLGSGPGWYTDYLSRRVHAVGIDVSPDFIRVAKKVYPDCDFRLGDLRKLDFPDGSVSGLAVIASLLHIPKVEAPVVLGEFRRVLKPQSKAVFLMKLPDDNYSGDGFETRIRAGKELTRFFSRYSEDKFLELLTANQFKTLEHEIFHFTPEDPEPWLISLAEVQNG